MNNNRSIISKITKSIKNILSNIQGKDTMNLSPETDTKKYDKDLAKNPNLSTEEKDKFQEIRNKTMAYGLEKGIIKKDDISKDKYKEVSKYKIRSINNKDNDRLTQRRNAVDLTNMPPSKLSDISIEQVSNKQEQTRNR